MEMGDVLQLLELKRAKLKEASHGIGEPAIRLNPDHILISTGDNAVLHITMKNLILLISEL